MILRFRRFFVNSFAGFLCACAAHSPPPPRAPVCPAQSEEAAYVRDLVSLDFSRRAETVHKFEELAWTERKRFVPCLCEQLRSTGYAEEPLKIAGPQAVPELMRLVAEGATPFRSLTRYVMFYVVILDGDLGLGNDYGFTADQLMAEAVAGLDDRSDEVRFEALSVLYRLGPKHAKGQIPRIEKMANDPDAKVREGVRQTLEALRK
jgi:hypothetical protein